MVTVIKIKITMDIPEWDRIMDIIIIVLEIGAVNTAQILSVDKSGSVKQFWVGTSSNQKDADCEIQLEVQVLKHLIQQKTRP